MELTISPITEEELPALTQLCVECSEFFEMVEGMPGSRHTAEEILHVLPPGKTASNKHLLGFSRDGALLAVADLGEDYPNTHDWYVALLLVAPASRRLGLGARVWAYIESWIRARGGKSIRLIVQQQNADARRFWEAKGFSVEDETSQILANHENRVWRMIKAEIAE